LFEPVLILAQARRNKKPGGEVANPHAGFLNFNLVSSLTDRGDKPRGSHTIQFCQVRTAPHDRPLFRVDKPPGSLAG
jgi:hypothetical protein